SSHIPVQLNPPTFGQKAFEQFRVKVPAGSYVLSVVSQESVADAGYYFEIAADTAPPASVTQNGTFIGFKDNVGHEFGSLTESPGVDLASEFLGFLDNGATPLFGDLEDLFTFDVPKDGHVVIGVNGLTPDPLESLFPQPPDIRVQLYHDSDRDGLFEPGESLNAAELLDVNQTYKFDGTL